MIIYTMNLSMTRPTHECKQWEKTYKVVNLHKLFKDAKSCQWPDWEDHHKCEITNAILQASILLFYPLLYRLI